MAQMRSQAPGPSDSASSPMLMTPPAGQAGGHWEQTGDSEGQPLENVRNVQFKKQSKAVGNIALHFSLKQGPVLSQCTMRQVRSLHRGSDRM